MIERLFNAYDLRGVYGRELNEDAAWKIGYATALYLQRSRQGGFAPKVTIEKTIVVGRDTRSHSAGLLGALIEGIRAADSDVVDLGVIDTPMLYFAINHLDCVAGIMVTGGYLPAEHGGFLISGPHARPISNASGLEDIRRISSTLRVGRTGLQGKLEQQDLWTSYRRHVLQFLNLQRTVRVAVDASNGAAAKVIPAVLGQIPQLEIIELNFDTDKGFSHCPDPLSNSAKQKLAETCAAEKVDLGACFSGDGSRVLFLDETGKAIRPDLAGVLMARSLIGAAGASNPIVVHDARCSRVLDEEIAAAGGKPVRDRVGRPYMKRALSDNEAIFGCEFTGQYYFRSNFNCESGVIALAHMLSIISAGATPLSEMVKPLQRYAHSGQIAFPADDSKARMRDIADKFRRGKIDYIDGITADMGDWWFNLRNSNTEPVMRLCLECTNPATLEDRLVELQTLLGNPIGPDRA